MWMFWVRVCVTLYSNASYIGSQPTQFWFFNLCVYALSIWRSSVHIEHSLHCRHTPHDICTHIHIDDMFIYVWAFHNLSPCLMLSLCVLVRSCVYVGTVVNVFVWISKTFAHTTTEPTIHKHIHHAHIHSYTRATLGLSPVVFLSFSRYLMLCIHFIRISFLHFDSMFGTWSVSPYKNMKCSETEKKVHTRLWNTASLYDIFGALVCVCADVYVYIYLICVNTWIESVTHKSASLCD